MSGSRSDFSKSGKQSAAGSIVIQFRDGHAIELPLKAYGETYIEGRKKAQESADFSGQTACGLCGGFHDERGAMKPLAGLINARVWHKKFQYWHKSLFACACVYGAWWATVAKIEFAEDQPDIPKVKQAYLTEIDLVRMQGETYAEGAESLPETFAPAILRAAGFSKKFLADEIEAIEREMIARKAEIIEALKGVSDD